MVRSFGFLAALFLCLLLGGFLSGCAMEDERDLCCEDVTIRFRYSKGDRDLFPQYITSLRHFLFDADGKLLRTIDDPQSPKQTLRLGQMPEGAYELVSVANLADASHLNPTTRRELELLLHKPHTGINAGIDDLQANGDPLYWGAISFESVRNERHTYLSDLSNIHCRLIVTVRWEGRQPQGETPFLFVIRGVPQRYSLVRERAHAIEVAPFEQALEPFSRGTHLFPYPYSDPGQLVTHAVEAPYLAGRVRAEFRTLRYTDEVIPYLQIYRSGAPILSKEIHLKEPFRLWKWAVTENIEQVYEIDLTILEDGTVVFNPGGRAKVLDWIDGGTIGMTW